MSAAHEEHGDQPGDGSARAPGSGMAPRWPGPVAHAGRP